MIIKTKLLALLGFPLIEKTDEQTRGSLESVQIVADLPNPKLPLLLSLLSPSAGSAVNSNEYENSFHIEKRDAVQNIIILYVNTFSFLRFLLQIGHAMQSKEFSSSIKS